MRAIVEIPGGVDERQSIACQTVVAREPPGRRLLLTHEHLLPASRYSLSACARDRSRSWLISGFSEPLCETDQRSRRAPDSVPARVLTTCKSVVQDCDSSRPWQRASCPLPQWAPGAARDSGLILLWASPAWQLFLRTCLCALPHRWSNLAVLPTAPPAACAAEPSSRAARPLRTSGRTQR